MSRDARTRAVAVRSYSAMSRLALATLSGASRPVSRLFAPLTRHS